SGQQTTFSYTVQNVGALGTGVTSWTDAAVLSLDAIYGNADDIPLGTFPHAGALNPNDQYTSTPAITLPNRISGDHHILVATDVGNAVNEFLLEGDNVTASSGTFHVNLANYPDLRVESLAAGTPDANGTVTISWNTANRGNRGAAGPWKERVVIRNL